MILFERIRSHPLTSLILQWRRVVAVVIHILLVALSNRVAFWLRFDGDIPPDYDRLWLDMLPWLLSIRIVTFIPLRLFEGLWRYTSLWDLRVIVAGVASSSFFFYVLVRYGFGHVSYPRSVYLVDLVLLVCLMTGVRLVRRMYREFLLQNGGRRVLIYGAGDAGEMIVREMRRGNVPHFEPIGLLDDDVTKVGRTIQGVRVLGTREALPEIMARHAPDEVLIAMPTADFRTLRELLRLLEPFKVRITTVPGLGALLEGKISINHIRSLQVEDLLPRAPVGLNASLLEGLLTARCVLVTGAGGSIGSELSRQIAEHQPEHLILFDRYENGLHQIATELTDGGFGCRIQPVVGDMTDVARVEEIFALYRPAVVFHAAAHKHVPLMESNVCEAVKNNVSGSRIVANAAIRHRVDRFVLISTDKAVNPTSVMGATKRLVEMLVQELASSRSATCFVTVRFGNVLGSNGSVLPRFMEQIRRGGPVTVTHPEIRRYFMLLPEAVQLVLHAAALNEQAAVYVLDMGDQIRLIDFARNLIRLAGFVPDEDIPIVITGLRPGEKLYEELVEEGETLTATNVARISSVVRRETPMATFGVIADVERLAASGDSDGVLSVLHTVLPTMAIRIPVSMDSISGA